MNPEVSKLIAAITALVSTLNESAGIPSNQSPSGGDVRYDKDKERVNASPGLLVRFAEPATGDKVWTGIAKIFAKSFESVKKKKPDYEEEAPTAVPTIIQQTAVAQEKKQEGFFDKLIKWLLPILALVGGIGLSIAALFQGPGPLGNFMNLVGKGLARYGMTFLEKVGNKLVSFSNEILEFLGKFADSGLSFISSGLGGIGKLFGKIAGVVGKTLLKVVKFIPFIGSAVSFYFAYQRFQQGDYVGMGLEIASGILNLIPGFGWIGAIIIDVVNIIRDFSTAKEEKAAGESGVMGKLFTGIGNFFKKNGMTILKSLPAIGSIVYFYEAYQAGFTTPEGIKKTITAFASVLGAGPLIEKAVNLLFSLFDEKEEEGGAGAPAAKGKSFFQIVKEFIVKSMKKLPFFIRKPLEWLGIIETAGEESEESWMSGGMEKAKEVGKDVLNKMSAFGSSVKDWFVSDTVKEFGGAIVDKMSAFGSSVKDWFISGGEKVKELGGAIVDKMSAFGSSIKDWFVSGKAKEFGQGVLDKMSELGSGVKDWLGDKLASAREASKGILSNITSAGRSTLDAAKQALDTVKNNIEKGMEVIKEFLTPVIDEMNAAANQVIEWVKKIFSWINSKVGAFASNIIDLFDFEDSKEPEKIVSDSFIKVKSAVLDAIAFNTNATVDVLREISRKMDNLSMPAPAAPSSPGPTAPTIPASNGGALTGSPRSQLFSPSNYSELI